MIAVRQERHVVQAMTGSRLASGQASRMRLRDRPGIRRRRPAGRRNGLGVASLVVGLVALLASLTVVGGLMLGVLAAMLGLLARAQVRHGQASNGDAAMTGVVLGVLAIVASLIMPMFLGGAVDAVTSGETDYEHRTESPSEHAVV